MKRRSASAGKKQRARVFLVDDHPLIRQGVADLINHQHDLSVCGDAGTVRDALAKIERLRPDVALIDLSLKDESGIDLIAKVRALPSPPAILVLSMHDERLFAERALRSGARGFVMKDAPPAQVIDGIRAVLAGEIFVSRDIASQMLRGMAARPTGSTGLSALTNRELDVFRLIGSGRNARQIATQLELSIKTVQTHRAQIMKKFGFRSLLELIHSAIDHFRQA